MNPPEKSFSLWLGTQRKEEGPIGELGAYRFYDESWPNYGSSETMKNYLMKKGRPDLVQLIDKAYKLWLSRLKRKLPGNYKQVVKRARSPRQKRLIGAV